MEDGNIENLCKVLRRSGGQINTGTPDPENLKLAAFYCRHQERVYLQINIAEITLKNKEVNKVASERKGAKIRTLKTLP